jgi:hypothetical protein
VAPERATIVTPSLNVGLGDAWGVDIYSLDGYDNPTTSDRGQYFSAPVRGVPRLTSLTEERHKAEYSPVGKDRHRL